jgi:Mg2+ and Co2+ transporter CorA
LQAGEFFWLDLEDPGDDELSEFSQSLQLPPDTGVSLVHASARSSFAPAADSIRAVLPAAVDTKPEVWLEANYVTVVLTAQFLFTVHVAPCAPLQHARDQYRALASEDAKADRARVLFLLLDVLIGSFRSQLLALDDRLGEIQLGMLRGASPVVHDELVQILGILTDGIQELGWYSHDLEEIAETVDQLPGMRPGAQQHFDRHRRRVTQMRENSKDIREEAKDALGHYSEFVAGRQAQVISSLTIVATVFLPLSFLTGYFGMNFRILTADLQNTLWQFILLGLLLPIASVSLSLLLIHRLERRFGIRRIGRRPS